MIGLVIDGGEVMQPSSSARGGRCALGGNVLLSAPHAEHSISTHLGYTPILIDFPRDMPYNANCR